MTAYKLVTIDAPYWGFGSRLEQALMAVYISTLDNLKSLKFKLVVYWILRILLIMIIKIYPLRHYWDLRLDGIVTCIQRLKATK